MYSKDEFELFAKGGSEQWWGNSAPWADGHGGTGVYCTALRDEAEEEVEIIVEIGH